MPENLRTFQYHIDNAANYNSQHIESTKPLFKSTSVAAIAVNPATYERLKIADTVSKAINNVMTTGNQATDVFDTRGENIQRIRILRSGLYSTANPISSKLFVGNCGEHANISEQVSSALNKQRRTNGKAEIPVVHAQWGNNHAFVLYGDPRETNAKQVAVVDPWVKRPSAHTLEQNSITLQGEGALAYSSSTVVKDASFLQEPLQKLSSQDFQKDIFKRTLPSREVEQLFHSKWEYLSNEINSNRPINVMDKDTFKKFAEMQIYKDTATGDSISFDYNAQNIVAEYDRKDADTQLADFPKTHPDESALPPVIPYQSCTIN